MPELQDGVAADPLSDLLLRWQELRDEGRPATAEELCAGRPELAAPLRERIEALRAMEGVLGLGPETVTGLPPLPDARTPSLPGGDGAARPGPYLPGYEVLGELERGGMGVVYKARNLRLNRVEAVKMILAGPHAGDARLARFRAEVEAVARLRHPHVVQVHKVGDHDGQPYFSMEFLDGGSLAGKLDGTPWAPRAAAELVRTVAGAVHFMHGHGVVHRDLKPGNVLLGADGAPKVGDFGLAKVGEGGLTQTEAVFGTPSYMSPEQARDSKAVDARTDVYALGAILYELLTGRPPFKGATSLETLDQVRSAEPVGVRQLQPKVARDLETITLKCLQKEPARRYASAGGLADDLGRFLEGRAVLARPVPAWERGLKWVRRQPALAALVLVSVVGAAALLGVWGRLTARLGEERDTARKEADNARKAEAKAWAAERTAKTNWEVAEVERAKAKRQGARAEALLERCRDAIHKHAVASRDAKSVGEGKPGAVLYELARFYAITSQEFRKDKDLSEADRAKVADQYAASAVKLLDCARGALHFHSPENLRKLREDPELRPLRGRDDFKQLLARVGG